MDNQIAIFTWIYGGRDVKIAGDFTNWIPVSMLNKEFIWEYKQQIPYGVHYYKFIVDGSWVYDMNIKYDKDSQGNINNVIQVNPKSPTRRIRGQ
ncbi:Carbohydrate-binding_module 48-containing protein [Hexamita inflata]|uniref:Carbohydrate-binding module 48-containing protein n=1 Tax=Hexamita inflata TaxID=28002 RepID=A0AA86P5F9_9EUKA|nr:Carbohydrate-binding module 48-containing protein [Hexamita inflata]